MDSNNWRVKRDPSDVLPKEQARTPIRSYQQRRNKESSFGSNSNSPYGQGSKSSPFGQQSRDSLRQPLADGNDKAIDEGRRLYVGNLPYEVSLITHFCLSHLKGFRM